MNLGQLVQVMTAALGGNPMNFIELPVELVEGDNRYSILSAEHKPADDESPEALRVTIVKEG